MRSISFRLTGLAWSGFYVLLVVAPLGAALVAQPAAPLRGRLANASIAIGFLSFTLVILQFALVSRLQWTSRRFGGDALLYLHRGIGLLVLVFLIGHGLASTAATGIWNAWNPVASGGPMRFGLAALAAVVLIVVTSLLRRSLDMSYEAWQAVHLLGASVAVVAGAAHILGVAGYAGTAPVRWTIGAYVALFVALLVRYRLIRPLRLRARPWSVASNRSIGGDTRLLRLRPDGHAGLTFAAGQFAWLLTGRTPFWAQHHPLSIASSAATPPADGIAFAIKALGDWSGITVPALQPGDRVWIDGPFGAFTPAVRGGRPLALVAGGVGITPVLSILGTLADRGDARPVVLVHAASHPNRALFLEETEALRARMPLQIVRVFERAGEGWTGEIGFITREILARHLPIDAPGAEYFICGPPRMIDSVERSLRSLGVPESAINTERFEVV